MSDQFVSLHTHTSYSQLDGASKIPELIARAKELGNPAIGISDHGNLNGIVEFYKECKSQDITPVLGQEFYFTDDRLIKESVKQENENGEIDGSDKRYYHLSVWAENNVGYHNLMKLSSDAFLNGYYYKPRSDYQILEEHAEGLMVGSGCLGGPVLQKLLHDDINGALLVAGHLQDIVGKDNFFIEMMNHGLPEQRKTNPYLIDIAKQLDAPLICTQDTHYTHKHDSHAHSVLLCCQTGARMSDPHRFKFHNDEYYLKSAQEMRNLFKETPEACDNTLLIASRSNVEIDFDTLHLPKFPVPEGYNSDYDFLEELTMQGLKRRYEEPSQEVFERAAYELSVIKSMNLSSYFLIFWDLVNFAQRERIFTGPGRGSAAGSIVSYSLGITKLDPIRHDLIFERFINPDRIALADVDWDIDTRFREKLINYTRDKYGDDRVAQIVTFNMIKARTAVRDSARVLGYDWALGDKISKAMPPLIMGVDTPLWACFKEVPKYESGFKNAQELRELYRSNSDIKEIVDSALGIEGLVRQDGIHAAAVVIGDRPLDELIPLQRRVGKPITTQYEKNTIEDLGLLKMDFLGLRNLDVISDTLDRLNLPFDFLETISLDDKEVYKSLQEGKGIGVFQVESPQMRELLERLRPTSIDDISAVLALYRPGPMAMNMHNDYADRKNGLQKIAYFHEDAKEILSKTFALCIFQDEKVMTHRGMIPIKDVQIGDIAYGEEGRSGKIINKQFTGDKEIVEVSLSNGRTIKCSEDHLFLTPDGYIKAKELDGKLVAIPYGLDVHGNVHDPELARLLAALIAEGSLQDNSSYTICNNDKEYREIVKSDLENRYPDLTTTEYFNTRAWYLSLRQKDRHKGGYHQPHQLKILLKEIGLNGTNSHTKFIPNIIWEMDLESKLEFMAMYINGDGHVGDNVVHIRTVSKDVAEGLHDLLISIGIYSSIYSYEDVFTIFIKDTSKFNELICPRLISSKQKLQFSTSSKGYAPLSVRSEWIKSGMTQRSFASSTGISCSSLSTERDFCRRDVAEKLDYSSLYVWELASVEETGILGTMYDIEVENIHSFVVGSAVTHNCIFQEQVMQIAQKFAGYTFAEADNLRKIMGKKLPDKMAAEKSKFVSGCINQGYDNQFSSDLFNMVEGFASYGFNASHSYSYGYITYWTAYLKVHHPKEYMASLCTSTMADIDKTAVYLNEARRMGLKVYPPDVNLSDSIYTVEDDGIRIGLNALKNLGEAPSKQIIKEREENGKFIGIYDFAKRYNPNIKSFQSLTYSGAFDAFGARQGMSAVAEDVLKATRKENKKISKDQIELFDTREIVEFEIPDTEYHQSELLKLEKQTLGIYVSGHPLDDFKNYITKNTIADLKESDPGKSKYKVLVIVTDWSTKWTKKGDQMGFLTVEDQTGSFEVVAFPKAWEKTNKMIVKDGVYIFDIRVSTDFRDQKNYVLVESFLVDDQQVEVNEQIFGIHLPKKFHLDIKWMSKLKGIVLMHQGKTPLRLYTSRSSVLKLTNEYFVDGNDSLKKEITELFVEYNKERKAK